MTFSGFSQVNFAGQKGANGPLPPPPSSLRYIPHYPATMGKISKGKQTKAFLKKGLLDGQIKKRHEVRAFKQKVKGRQVQRNKGHGPKPTDPQAEEESDEDGPVKVAEEDSEDEMDVDAVLGGEAVEEVRFALQLCSASSQWDTPRVVASAGLHPLSYAVVTYISTAAPRQLFKRFASSSSFASAQGV